MDSVHHIWCPLSSQEFQDLPDGAETTLTLFPPLRKEGYATERTYHQNPNVHNQSLFFQTDDRVLR
ncbi:TPA: hypothetical protein MHS85_28170 [Klebsiella pneumoniae]|nr:hypothetical protein [Klebsiella pneumoniae]HBX2409951.1 hypothetical protein [Klebsiella pneumoniae]